jgi:hypothetical protein
MRLNKSPATLGPAPRRTPVSAAQPGTQAVADQRKPVPSTPKKALVIPQEEPRAQF